MKLIHSPNIKPLRARPLTAKEIMHQNALDLAAALKRPSVLTVDYILEFEEQEEINKSAKRKKLDTNIEVPLKEIQPAISVNNIVGLADEILKYKNLLNAEAITESEFQTLKGKLLAL